MKNKYIIESEDKSHIIYQKYSSLINQDLNQLLFLYKGKYLNIKENIDTLNNKKITIFVFNKNQKDTKDYKQIIKDLICPKCETLSLLNLDEDSFNINNCINNHYNHYKIRNLNSLIYSQKINVVIINRIIII